MSPSADPAAPAVDLLRTVSHEYGLSAPISVERLTGGYANDVFLLRGDRSVVLHVKHPPLDLEGLSWEHQLLELLRPHLSEIPGPLRTLDGRTFLLHRERPLWLLRTLQVFRRSGAIGVPWLRPLAGCTTFSST